MTQFDQFASHSVWAGGRLLTLGEALDREPTDLVDPLWGVIAAWDPDRRRHIVNWDLGWVLVDAADDDWPRRQIIFELAADEPLDLELIAAAAEQRGAPVDRDLVRERGGRVRAVGADRWLAEHGPVHRPLVVGEAGSSDGALGLLQRSCESSRLRLRSALRSTGDSLLSRIATARWWCPRYDVWPNDPHALAGTPVRPTAAR
jgi:hypothetical protein